MNDEIGPYVYVDHPVFNNVMPPIRPAVQPPQEPRAAEWGASMAALGDAWASIEREAWLEEHMRLVEAYGLAARGFQSWLTTKDSSRALVLPGETKCMEDALEAVEAHARRIAQPAPKTQVRPERQHGLMNKLEPGGNDDPR